MFLLCYFVKYLENVLVHEYNIMVAYLSKYYSMSISHRHCMTSQY